MTPGAMSAEERFALISRALEGMPLNRGTSQSDHGDRIYLAYLVAREGEHPFSPNPVRERTIRELRKQLEL